jgi:hypothetical protein
MLNAAAVSWRRDRWLVRGVTTPDSVCRDMPVETVVIDRRFRGPPESGQGGYSCGLLARALTGAVEVRLRHPPPLERPLTLEPRDDDSLALCDGESMIAEARPTALELNVPSSVTIDDAQAAVAGYVGFTHHPFPMCFACGPHRGEGDGLRLFPGPIAGRDVVACPWRPGPDLADADGIVRPEIVWAALDCPTAFACDLSGPPIVLARLRGRIDQPIPAGDPLVVTAWALGRGERKHHSACAISNAEGELLALSQALWIELKDSATFGAADRPTADSR